MWQIEKTSRGEVAIFKTGNFRIVVTYNHLNFPDAWSYSVNPAIPHRQARATNRHDAQAEAIEVFGEWLQNSMDQLADAVF